LAWSVKFSATAHDQLRRLDGSVQVRIVKYLRQRLASRADPRQLGASLTGKWGGFWKYRVGDYRLICEIVDEEVLVLVVKVGHRGDVYD
jgi:mRNA interferase RelE/StbE